MAKIKTLLEGTTQIAPRTKVKAVSDDDGTGLDALLDGKQSTDKLSTDWTSADNSHYPSTKLVKDEVDSINGKLGVSLTLTGEGLLHLEEI